MSFKAFSRFLFPASCFLLLVYLFFPWFKLGIITYGDWWFRFFDPLNPVPIKYLWDSAGFGQFSILWGNLYWIGQIQNFFRQIFNSYDPTGTKVAFYFPYLIFLFLSTAVFSLKFLKTNLARLTFFLAFSLSTYFLLLVRGGLITLADSAVLLPLIFSLFYKALEGGRFKWMILTGLTFALSLAYDPRLAFLNLLVLFLFSCFYFFLPSKIQPPTSDLQPQKDWFLGISLKKLIRVGLVLLVMGIITAGWHANWILPGIFYKAPTVPWGYDQPYWVDLLSHQNLLNALVGFHSGFAPQLGLAVGQIPPLFFVLGILGVLGIWLNRKEALTLLFGLLFLLFSFLVKGSNPPLGGVYLWIFKYLPGFNMFRDPTKFFAPLGFGLAYLLAVGVETIWSKLGESAKCKVQSAKLKLKVQGRQVEKINFGVLFYWVQLTPYVIVLAFFIMLTLPAWMHSLGGTFTPRQIPKDYLIIKKFLAKQPDWFRTLWVPGVGRWSYQTTLHPALSALTIANQRPFGRAFPGQTAWDALSFLWGKNSNNLVDLAGVKYIFVPLLEDDATPFVNDNPIDRVRLREKLDSLNWLTPLDLRTATVLVYENRNFLPLGWVEEMEDRDWRVGAREEIEGWKLKKKKITPLNIDIVNPTQYALTLSPAIQSSNYLSSRLVFSQAYDQGWVFKLGGQAIASQKCYGLFNCFKLGSLENGQQLQGVGIKYFPQKYADAGEALSQVVILVFSGALLLVNFLKNKS